MKQVLVETINFSPVRALTESRSDRGNPVVEGILATVETINENGRFYKKSIWEREVDKYKQLIAEKRALGELDHPDSMNINLKNVCHNITDLWWDGKNIMGKLEILPTPSGQIVKNLIDNGITLGVSSRGTGTLQQRDGVNEVQDDFELLCWDFVSTPSNPGSFVQPIRESKQLNIKSNIHNTISELLCMHGQCEI
jgi:hypothetical protein